MTPFRTASAPGATSRDWRAVLKSGLFLALVSILSSGAGADEPFEVVLVVQESASYTDQIVTELEHQLRAGCPEPCAAPARLTLVDQARAAAIIDDTAPELTVAIGSSAASMLARMDGDGPRLYAFIPSHTWSELRACCAPDATTQAAIFIDQPAERLLRLVRALQPDAGRVGVLLGEVSRARYDELTGAAERLGIEVITERVSDSDNVGRQLRKLLGHIDFFVTLPDPLVYNRNTVYPILLTTYSAGVPVLGFSSTLVDAGAAAGVFMSPQDAGKAIASAIKAFRETGKLPETGYADTFSLSVNERVLRSLKIDAVPLPLLKERSKGNSR